jgi:mRNA interferase MazF
LKVRRGDVILMVAAGDLGKPRPGVVVQADRLGDETTAVIVCPFTSDTDATEDIRPTIEPAEGNGILLVSQVMTDKIVALGRSRIRRVIGRLDEEAIERIDRALLVVLGLTLPMRA